MITKEALHKKSPQEVTALLYEACMDRLEEAKARIEANDLVGANHRLQKSSDIFERLGAGLNYEAGIISDQLEVLYMYMADLVVQANYQKNTALIDEVLNLLATLSQAWHQAMNENRDLQPKAAKQKVNAYERSVMYDH
nr:flagellar export chaperone FliS [Alteribacter populi]